MKDETLLLLGFFVLIMALFGGFWVLAAHQEAKAYNRLTGAHATTWDAMWVELRVQDKTK